MGAQRATKPEASGGSLSSVDNALHLLSLVGERRALRVAEAAEELQVARSTAHRLLTALRNRGFVTQERPNSVYRPGSALLEIGLAAVGRLDIRRAARPVLEQLRDESGETTSLALLEGTTVRFIDCIESQRSVRVGSRTGIVLPAHTTAGGKAILAALPEGELERRYPGADLEPRTESSVRTRTDLERELDEVRRCGYASNGGESESSIGAVGAAVHDLIGYPLAAIAIAIPMSRFEKEHSIQEYGAMLLRGADAIREGLVEEA